MKVVLPDPVADQLAELAKAVQESPSTLAAQPISAAWLDESLPLDLALAVRGPCTTTVV